MQILDWIRDGFLGERTHMKRASRTRRARPEREEREDPSGRHDFGRRAHHPDPKGHYQFEPHEYHRLKR
jgi:hypothetical protein